MTVVQQQRDARVVIVDDTPDMRMVLALMLSRYDGVDVVAQVGDGMSGIEAVREHQPDLVLLDLAMPRMDGLEALPHIKAAAPECEVIVLSGFESQRMGMRALDAGASAYIQKGASPDELVGAVSGVLGRDLIRRTRDTRKSPPPAAPAAPPADAATAAPAADPDAVSRAIARVAHELRNPALALSFLADELANLRKGMDRGPEDIVIEAILRQAAVIDQLTNDLMTSSHARRGSLAVHLKPVPLAPVIKETLPMVPDAGDVEVACPPELIVNADKVRFQQMLTNLVSNALRYGQAPVRILADRVADDVQVRVVDAGDGVPEWFQDRLFDEYSRASASAGVGTGIGLYIVRAIAEAHGGRAWYEPRPKGAAFVVSLPAPELRTG